MPISRKNWRDDTTRLRRHATGRRRGQALLLAVLIMVFAALLGATFITVVAINLSQTSRSEDRVIAQQGADAGLRFADQKITYGLDGRRWRPEDESQPPVSPLDVYWTENDRARGYPYQGNATDRDRFVKYPDPRNTNLNDYTTAYMLRVEEVETGDPDNANNDKTGELRITSIGLSPNDPTVFVTRTEYKAGPAQSPGTRSMLTYAAYDHVNHVVPSARVSGYTTGATTTLTVKKLTGILPEPNFYITVGTAIQGAPLEGALVTKVTANATPGLVDLELSEAMATAPTANDRVDLASGVGAPNLLDYDKDSAVDDAVDYNVSELASGKSGSIQANGGLVFYGTTNLDSVRSIGLGFPGRIECSGLFTSNAPNANATVTLKNATYYSSTGTTNTLPDTVLPAGSNSGTVIVPGVNADESDRIMADGFGRLSGANESTRQVKEFTPPDINLGGDGVGRYRALSKFSEPALITYPSTAGVFGWGRGIYIDNADDIEKKASGNGYAPMTLAELRKLWYDAGSTSSAEKYLRNATPVSANPAATPAPARASLEEQHFRGWVGPELFRARGALLEIDPVAGTVTITRDSRTDGLPNALGPVLGKQWRDAGGNALNTYRQVFNWPANGVIFAEGNLRVRTTNVSTTADPGRSLTIVSMNNIYIEGNINAGIRKVWLIAKRNIVVNPTGLLEQADSQTTLSNNVAAGVTSIPVYEGNTFNPGEYIVIGNNGTTQDLAVVTSVGANSIDFLPALANTHIANEAVVDLSDPHDSNGLPFSGKTYRLYLFAQVLQRRYRLDAAGAIRLAIRQSSERRNAIQLTTVQADLTGIPPLPPELSAAVVQNKKVASGGVAQTTDKYLQVNWTEINPANTGNDQFPNNPLSLVDDNAALAYRLGEQTDSDTASSSDDLQEDLTNRRAAINWYYTATVQNTFDAGTVTVPPWYFLAGIGNLNDPENAQAKTPSIMPGTTLDIPMGNSIVAEINQNTATLRSDVYNATLGTTSGFEEVQQLGICPTYGIGSTSPYQTWEDVLTTDQSFYKNGAVNATDALYDSGMYNLDTRTIANNVVAGVNVLAFRLNPALNNYFDPNTDARVPYYRLSRIKPENVTLDGTTHELSTLDPIQNQFDIEAYCYAQEGNFLIISGESFDGDVKRSAIGTYLDLDQDNVADSNEYYDANSSGTYDAGDFLDLNRDGVQQVAELYTPERFARYNYQIKFTGAIMQNTSPVIVKTGNTSGQVSDWMDKWTTSSVAGGAITYGNITYTFDDSAMQGMWEDDPGFQAPVTPDVIYEES